jgi:FkbM family methyltransferase
VKKTVKKLFSFLGYEISRKQNKKLVNKVPQVITSRSSMLKSIEWLHANHFDVNTVLDVGASDGRWSIDCMKHYNDAYYVLFEPQICHSKALDSMETAYSNKVKIVKKAVGLKSGKTNFDISDPFGGALRDSKNTNTVEVSLISIDDSLKETGLKGPFLIKLDTHGFEIPIMEGAANTLDECNILIIEAYNYNIEPKSVLFWQLCEYLYRKGFRPIDLVDIMHREYDNSLWQMDIVFIKSSWPGFGYISYK